MGIILLALIAGGALPDDADVPVWVIVSCALAIGLGTYLGGWRVIRTLGKGLVDIESPQGLAAETSSAVVILVSSNLGFPLSTTHVASGSIMGSGVGRGTPGPLVHRAPHGGRLARHAPRRRARRALRRRPCRAGSAARWATRRFSCSSSRRRPTLFVAARRSAVNHHNVNDEWSEPTRPARQPATV